MHIVRVEVTPKLVEGMIDVRGDLVKRRLSVDSGINVEEVRSIVGFLVNSDVSSEEIASRAYDLFADPIIEHSLTDHTFLNSKELFEIIPDAVVSVGFKPGVTDNPGKAALDGFRTIFPEANINSDISTYISYAFYGINNQTTPEFLASTLYNNLIERAVISDAKMCQNGEWPMIEYPTKPAQEFKQPAHIDLEISDNELIKISESGLLALNLSLIHI